MSRYLVTGCAGFIGSHLADALLRSGHDVVGVDRFSDYYPRAVKEANLLHARTEGAFSFTELDLADGIKEAFAAQFDGIFHLAGQPGVRTSWRDFELYARDNLVATQRLLEAAAGKTRVVFASSSSVYGTSEAYPTHEDAVCRPISPYGVSKLSCEQMALAYETCFGLEVVSLRFFTVYGPRQRPDMLMARILASLLEAVPFQLYGSGNQSRSFTYVAEAVEASIKAMEYAPPGTTVNVGGGEEASVSDVIRRCERLTGRSLRVERVRGADGDVRRTAADIARARAMLDWEPTTSLDSGLAAQLEWITGTARAE